jgi:hypothetical protein
MKPLDSIITLLRSPRTDKNPGARSVSPRYCLHLIVTTLILGLLNINNSYAYSKANDVKELKGYAYSQMSWPHFECYNYLITAESHWNPRARNGSHYGLAQMRNPKVRWLNGFQQIDWHLRYLKHRYDNDPCKALAHFESKGWH